MTLQNLSLPFQCGRKLRGYAGHENHAGLHGARRVAAAGDLQEQLRDRRRVLSVRRADLCDEVRQLDVRRVPGGPATHRRVERHERRGHRHRSDRVLRLGRVGHPGGACDPKREILYLLRRAVPGHHLQHHDAPEDALLYRQPHHTVHGHQFSNDPSFLLALGQRREGTFRATAPSIGQDIFQQPPIRSIHFRCHSAYPFCSP